jgi:hypothetical protein
MITITCRRQVLGDLTTAIGRVSKLHADLLLIRQGELPSHRIADAPLLDKVVLAKRFSPCLIGHLGPASADSRVIQTSEIWVADWHTGWVRTETGFYRLGRVLDLDTK